MSIMLRDRAIPFVGQTAAPSEVIIGLVRDTPKGRGQLKCDGTHPETRFRL